MWLCCPPGRKTLRPVFSRRGSDANWVSYVHKCVRCASFQTKIQFSMLKFFYTVVAKCYKNNMPPINAFCINCNILIKPQSVDAFCTKNFSLMQNASTLPTHFVTKKSKCYYCNIGAKCVVSAHKPSPWILVLFLMQMTKHKYGTKTYHSKVPLRFIKITQNI